MESLTLFGRTFTMEDIRRILLVVAVGLFAWGLLTELSPRMTQFSELNDLKATGEKEIEAAASLTSTEAEVRARREQAERHLDALRGRLPTRAQVIPTLLVDLSEIFRSVHVRLSGVQPKEFVPLERASLQDVGRLSIEITAQGTYPAVIALFDRFSKYDRILLVENPILTPSGDEGSLAIKPLGITFTLTTYALSQ